MQAKGTNTSSNLNIRVGYKKVFCNLCGSHISIEECAYSTITHDPRLPSTPPVDPCVSCKVFIESTHISKITTEDITKTTFNKKVIGDLDFILVGLGEKGGNCGEIFASLICKIIDCMKVHYTKQSCGRRACPECWKKWLVEERENIIARLLSEDARKMNAKKRLVDIILSPDPKIWPKNEDEFGKLLKSGYRYIRKKGARGGCVVIHPFRATEEAKRLSINVDVKTWKWIRRQENPERYFYYSPHLHLLAYVDHMKEPEEGEKWIYKTKTNEEGSVIDFLRKAKRGDVLRKRINYFLSHTGTLKKEEGKFHCVRWFGNCSYNQLATTCEEYMRKEEREGVEKRCKICGGDLMPFWSWVSRSFGDVLRDIRNNVLDPPRYWDEVVRTVEREDPPADAEEYLI